MKDNFEQCLQLVLKDEGGYSNDPDDSGGPTKYGITIGDVQKYVKKNATADDVKRLTVEQAGTIYKQRYWDALDCDSLSSGVDYSCFDYGVNSGLGRPRAVLKKFSDKSGVDLINAINNERTAFVRKIGVGKDSKFLRGWLLRINRVRSVSLALAKKNNVAGPTVAAGSAGVFALVANYLHAHPYVIAGVVCVGILSGVLIHFIINKGK
jgi:lysozyme family protein